jgi:2-polyprenyl-6-methoxyphenol hydroxylase-like FAD-dependent oxidoreductase
MVALNTLIVGGGIAGLCCAIALRKAGHDVHLVEIEESWTTYPTGISLQAHTYRAFAKIGVVDEVAALGFTAPGARVCKPDGTVVAERLGKPLGPGLPIAGGIMRPVLQDILARKTRELGVRVSLGVSFARIENLSHGVKVDFTDGTSGTYDLAVGADGVFSKVRSAIFPDAPAPKYTGQCSFRKAAPRPPDIDMMTIFLGNPIKAGVTPASKDELFLWALSPEPTDEYLAPARQVERLREILKGFGGVLGQIRDSLTPETEIVYRPLKTIVLTKPWHRDRVIVIGDAAHATTPHLASGASAAIEDAWLLADYLSEASSIEIALREFTERRLERCRFIVETSARIGELEVSGAPSSEQERLYAEGLEVLAAPV